jgi:hypothetical protein
MEIPMTVVIDTTVVTVIMAGIWFACGALIMLLAASDWASGISGGLEQRVRRK